MAKKKSPPPEPAHPPVSAEESVAKLGDTGTAGLCLAVSDYIRWHAAGLGALVPFDRWAEIVAAARRVESPVSVAAEYAANLGLSEEDQLSVLLGYVDNLATPEAAPSFREFLVRLFADPADAPAAVPEKAELAEAIAEDEALAAEEAHALGADDPDAPASALDRRVVHITAAGDEVHGVCIAEHEDGSLTVLTDAGDEVEVAGRDRVRVDDGPITWTATAAEVEQVRGWLAGKFHNRAEAECDVLFERVRRVSGRHLCCVMVHNAKPRPYVAASVYDDLAPEGVSPYVFDHPPVHDLAGEYRFVVPGLGAVAGRVAVVD